MATCTGSKGLLAFEWLAATALACGWPAGSRISPLAPAPSCGLQAPLSLSALVGRVTADHGS